MDEVSEFGDVGGRWLLADVVVLLRVTPEHDAAPGLEPPGNRADELPPERPGAARHQHRLAVEVDQAAVELSDRHLDSVPDPGSICTRISRHCPAPAADCEARR